MNQERPPIVFYAFDLLQLNGRDLRNLPVEQRKGKLEALLKKPPGVIPIFGLFHEGRPGTFEPNSGYGT
jgi:ATP-dependent DNA ligase